MNLERAPAQYNQANEQRLRDALANNDMVALKTGKDVELARGERLILRDTNGVRYSITVSTLGVLTATAL